MRWLRKLFRYPRTRANYWSCSALSDWLRKKAGLEKPTAATLEEWSEWKTASKSVHGFVYWLTEEAFDAVQDFVMFPADVWDAFRVYVRNRFVDKPHYLNTKLDPGGYYEVDTRILHGLFETLVDFIECEKAWMCVVFDDDAKKKYDYPAWSVNRWLRFGAFRCPQAGIDHLVWEMGLCFGENDGIAPDHELFGQQTPQAKAAHEQLHLYNWWKNLRPLRIDPIDAVEGIGRPERFDKMNELEQAYEKEDEEMLIRLIKIRRSLWT